MIYLDACYIAKLYLPESDSPAVRAAAQVAGLVACSLHGQVEVLSVFHRMLREKMIVPAEFDSLCAQFKAECTTARYCWFPVSTAIAQRAVTTIRKLPASAFLRAADALHLSASAEMGFATIFSSDKHLLASAHWFGLTGVRL